MKSDNLKDRKIPELFIFFILAKHSWTILEAKVAISS